MTLVIWERPESFAIGGSFNVVYNRMLRLETRPSQITVFQVMTRVNGSYRGLQILIIFIEVMHLNKPFEL